MIAKRRISSARAASHKNLHFGVKPLNKEPSRATLRIVESLGAIPASLWDALVGDYPFLRHAFLRALETSGCVGKSAGWEPRFITLWHADALLGAMPLYRKTHSYGEYVFDWAWADAYARHGLAYYPKLVCAVPFTPVAGPRLLAPTPTLRRALIDAALDDAKASGASSLHCLFLTADEHETALAAGMLARQDVQFHWYNDGYADFDAFLAAFNHDKRKKIKQERKALARHGLSFEWLSGSAIEPEHWRFFERCYRTTYHAHHSHPYLNLAFFETLGATMAEQILLVLARQDGTPVAAALNLFDARNLYGRYWGSVADIPGLHFETCYYQAIEFCIARKLAHFDAGAQGRHKLARGFVPRETRSAHWLAHAEFSLAVERYLAHEAQAVGEYVGELEQRSPFRRTNG